MLNKPLVFKGLKARIKKIMLLARLLQNRPQLRMIKPAHNDG